VEANSTGGQGSRRAVAPSDDDSNTLKNKENYSFVKMIRPVNNPL
jgi:hypothetical protein